MTQVKYETLSTVDENQTRIHAALVVLLIGAYLFTGNLFIIYTLVYDFLVRIYVAPLLSPLYVISLQAVKIIGLEKKIVDAYKKEFASHVGLTILLIVLFAELFHETYIAFILITFFGAWKALEAIDNICIACKFYELLKNKNIEVVSL
ncbi:MAG: DUF4395 domain-containing protein [Sulfurimonas sp.]|nr:DUF4395 domain-containing protein [Sulfurimonas sp.]